jgi:hypothetical protein
LTDAEQRADPAAYLQMHPDSNVVTISSPNCL